MADLRHRYHGYDPQSSGHDDILRELDDRMGERYDVATETSLKNDFLEACFARIEPDQRWKTLVKSHENYDPSWRPQKQRATALRMLLTEQIGWPESEGLLGFRREYLAGILLAIEASDEGISRSADHTTVTLDPEMNLEPLSQNPPDRAVPESTLPTLLTFSNSIQTDAESFLADNGIDPTTGEHHVVYVLDCTPAVANEREAIISKRQEARVKSAAGNRLDEKEAAAAVLNDSKGILYVGYTHEFPRRMKRHYEGTASGSAEFVNLYKPKQVLEVTEYDSEGAARNRERMRADELRRETDWYVYQH